MPIDWPFPEPNVHKDKLWKKMPYEQRMNCIRNATIYWLNYS